MTRNHRQTYRLRFHWGTSRAADSYGYNVCSLYVDDKLVARCNGGGYDMKGTVFGNWIVSAFADKLAKLKTKFYGLSWHDPKFDSSKAKVPGTEQTVEEREAAGDSIGLERYQAFYCASNDTRTKRHNIPLIDGACGMSSMETILKAIGGNLEWAGKMRNDKLYLVWI